MVFGKYADFYDLFYKNKSYAAECLFVQDLFSRYAKRRVVDVLDLGCGTAGHALALAAQGFCVTGIDASACMLALAKAKADKAGLSLSLARAQLQDFKLARSFDAVICMFSVIDYLTKDTDLQRMLANVRLHLRPGGVFICDFWHAPAIASFVPYKNKIFRQGGLSVRRESHTRLLAGRRICEVRYKCTVQEKGEPERSIDETHRMRYFDIEEMNACIKASGLKPLASGPFLNLDRPIRKNTWDVVAVAGRPKAGSKT